jgi:hypothetical protein
MYKKQFFLFLLLFAFLYPHAQTSINEKYLQSAEQMLSKYAFDIVNAEEMVDRLRADSFFTRNLVQALKTPYSFNYSFDSLKTISRLYAPDSSFRIITWQLMKDFTYYRYKGAIQLKTNDGSLKLIPLYDGTDFTEKPTDSVRTNENWIGALYYNIVLKKFNNKNYYTLIGYDENDARSTKKWLEVLTFNNNNRPQFGGRFFNYPNDAIKPPQPAYRFCLEFKKEANAKLNYDAEIDRIVFAKLVSETGEISKKHTLVPYGTIEGFKWELGKWIYIPNIEF